MRRFFLISIACFLLISFKPIDNNTWSQEELASANTAKDAGYLTKVEKETIQYINLARMYPKKFVKLEVKNYVGPTKFGDYLKNSSYKESLIKELNKSSTKGPLNPDSLMSLNAKCFAVELGEAGRTGHDRKNCEKKPFAECISYGMEEGKDIALQLLIDHDLKSLIHRKICLDGQYSKAGLNGHSHKKYLVCMVIEFI